MFYPKFILFLGKTFFMKPAQNFKNHPKLVKGFHGLLSFCILALLGGSVSYFFLAEEGHAYPASLFLLIVLVFLIMACPNVSATCSREW